MGSILFAAFFGIGHFFSDISLRITKICFEKFGLRIAKENLGIETALTLVFNHQNDVILVRMLRKAFGGEMVTEYFNKEIKGTAGPFHSGFSADTHAVNDWIRHINTYLRQAFWTALSVKPSAD